MRLQSRVKVACARIGVELTPTEFMTLRKFANG